MLNIHVVTKANLKYRHCKRSSLNDSNTQPFNEKKKKKYLRKTKKEKYQPQRTFSLQNDKSLF